MRIYLAGPMRNYLNNNRYMFMQIARELREQENEVFDPANDGMADDRPMRDYMQKDLSIILNWAEAVVLMIGWEHSEGASLEAIVAQRIGLKVFQYSHDDGRLTLHELTDKLRIE